MKRRFISPPIFRTDDSDPSNSEDYRMNYIQISSTFFGYAATLFLNFIKPKLNRVQHRLQCHLSLNVAALHAMCGRV